MVETRSRTRTQQKVIVVDVPPKKKRPRRSTQSVTPSKKCENISRKRGHHTPSTPIPKKMRLDTNKGTDNKQKRSTSVSKSPPVVYDEIIEDDITKDVDKPEDTQSPSKSPSVHSETIVDAINTKPSNINMTTPENNRTSAKTKLASIRRSQNIEPHQTSSSSSWQNDNLPERMPYQSWSHKYYDLQDPFHLPPDLPIDKPAIIHSDRLFDDEHEMIFARESSTESVLPSPSTSLDSTISEESFEKSLPEKKQQGFFGNFCSIM